MQPVQHAGLVNPPPKRARGPIVDALPEDIHFKLMRGGLWLLLGVWLVLFSATASNVFGPYGLWALLREPTRKFFYPT